MSSFSNSVLRTTYPRTTLLGAGQSGEQDRKGPCSRAYTVFKETDQEQGHVAISTVIYDSNGCYKDAKRERSGTKYLGGG